MLRYAITNRMLFAGSEHDQQAKSLLHMSNWATEGVDFIQLREKDLDAGALVDLTRKIQQILRSHTPAPKLLINSRADVAVAAEADGVHLTSAPGSLTPEEIRSLYSGAGLPEPVISISCHTLADVVAAREAGVTLILFGPVFEKRIGCQLVSTGIGLDLLRAGCVAAAPVPVLALGGVTQSNVAVCLTAGAAGIAAIRFFTTGLTEPSQPD